MANHPSILSRTISTPIILVGVLLVIALVAVGAGSGPFTRTIVEMFIRVMIVVGLYTFIGNSGVISFGHIGFMCLGAYATAWFTIPPAMKKISLRGLPDFIAQHQLPFIVSIILATLFAGIFAYIFGRILMRLSGIAASIATFAMLAVINTVYSNWESVTGATSSIVGIPMRTGLWTSFIGAVIAVIVAYAYAISRSGLALRAARDEATAASASGVDITRERLRAFVISGLIIGKAVEIGKSIFNQAYVPLVVGAPQLKRYTAFGHLFAAYEGKTYRIDRHPVMSRHPVTPMQEADLCLHLAYQTALPTALIDLTLLHSHNLEMIDGISSSANGIVLLDVDSPETQRCAGEQLWRLKNKGGWFVAGSSGVEYALLSCWKNIALINDVQLFESPGNVDRIAVVSGSVSPTTERQIHHASQNGFDLIRISPLDLVGENETSAMDSAVTQAHEVLRKGRSPLVYTALGPSQDISIELEKNPSARHRIGHALGGILRRLVELQDLKRVVIGGGDTSSHALRELEIEALTTLMPLPATPGSPLCLAHSSIAATDGLQIALKGGQIGGDDYFAMIRRGG